MSSSSSGGGRVRRRALWVLATSVACLVAAIFMWTQHAITNDNQGKRKLYVNLSLFGLTPQNYTFQVPTAAPSTSPLPTRTPTAEPSKVPSLKPSDSPSLSPTDDPSSSPSASPTNDPSSSPSFSPSTLPSASPTNKPSASPSSSPTSSPSASPSSLPSQSPTDFFATTTFYAIADLPYNLRQKQEMPGLIDGIPANADFLVHLGDIKASAAPCDNANFAICDSLLSKSKVPTFIVIGDNEWNNCKNPTAAFDLWRWRYVRFDRKYWNHDLPVKTMPGRLESFSFVNRGTLFIGLNLVGSPVVDWTEWNNRTRTQLDWTLELIEQARTGYSMPIGAIVIFAHANLDGKHRLFVDPLVAYVRDVLKDSIPIMYMGGDNHSWLYEPNYKGRPSFLRVRKTGGTNEPPLTVVVNPAAGLLQSDYGVKASTERAFQLTRFPTSDIANFNGGRFDVNGTEQGGIASEDLDDDIFTPI